MTEREQLLEILRAFPTAWDRQNNVFDALADYLIQNKVGGAMADREKLVRTLRGFKITMISDDGLFESMAAYLLANGAKLADDTKGNRRPEKTSGPELPGWEFRAPIGVRIGLTVACVLLFFACAVCGIACLVAAPAEAGYLWWGLGWLAAGIASAGGIVYFADV